MKAIVLASFVVVGLACLILLAAVGPAFSEVLTLNADVAEKWDQDESLPIVLVRLVVVARLSMIERSVAIAKEHNPRLRGTKEELADRISELLSVQMLEHHEERQEVTAKVKGHLDVDALAANPSPSTTTRSLFRRAQSQFVSVTNEISAWHQRMASLSAVEKQRETWQMELLEFQVLALACDARYPLAGAEVCRNDYGAVVKGIYQSAGQLSNMITKAEWRRVSPYFRLGRFIYNALDEVQRGKDPHPFLVRYLELNKDISESYPEDVFLKDLASRQVAWKAQMEKQASSDAERHQAIVQMLQQEGAFWSGFFNGWKRATASKPTL